jgi:choline monooxygenase
LEVSVLLPEFIVDERLAHAETPHATWYVTAEALEAERRAVFAKTWQLVGREEQVSTPGAYFTAEIAGEPLVVVRGVDGELRALSNVCRHRAGPVATGAGHRKGFQCGYHGWTYALDGRLVGTPEFDGVERFVRSECRLPSFRVDAWNGLVFATLDADAGPLSDVLGGIAERVAHLDLGAMRLAARKDWYIDCNWKVYVDNYLEGYHIPIVHPTLNEEIDYRSYRTETFDWFSIQHAPIRRKPDQRLRVTDGASGEAQYFWVFPNLMLNVYPDNFSTNVIVPLGPERTLTVFEWYFAPSTAGERDAADRRVVDETVTFSDEIQIEDIGICETVQRNLRSSSYSSGRYSVRRENGVHHFHRLLARMLAARASSEAPAASVARRGEPS